MPLLSIIIPTHRRPEILTTCLLHLSRQTIAKDLEVIVVSDGGDTETDEAVRMLTIRYPLPVIRFLKVSPCHQGTARNRGTEQATAPIVLFIGDDIFLEPDACERHASRFTLRQAQGESFATLGFTTWDPALEITPTMRWLEQSGWQFGYPKITQFAHDFLPKAIQADFTYTSHISLPTEIAKRFPFREDVSLYGWEDIEWGMRLRDAGVRLFYEPDAKAFHHHSMTLEDSLRRMETLGESLVTMAAIVPEFQEKLVPWKLLVHRFLALFPTKSGWHRRAFLRGVRNARDQ